MLGLAAAVYARARQGWRAERLIAITLAIGAACGSCSRDRGQEPAVPVGQASAATQATRSTHEDAPPWVYVPGTAEVEGPAIRDGRFRMGRPLREGFTDEQPDHYVGVSAFRLGRCAVTNAEFAEFLNRAGMNTDEWFDPTAAGGIERGADGQWRAVSGRERWPVTGVSWYGAKAYCESVGGRLPTEAEWEWAAVGPEWRVYPWGDEWDPSKCCCLDNPGSPYVDVDAYPEGASWCGALNMAGNCWEWCADWYGPYSADPQDNPTGPAEGTERVIRGGFYKNAADLFRGSCRLRQAPDVRRDGIGFRCAWNAEENSETPGGDPAH